MRSFSSQQKFLPLHSSSYRVESASSLKASRYIVIDEGFRPPPPPVLMFISLFNVTIFQREGIGLYFDLVLMGLRLKFVLLSFLWMDKPKSASLWLYGYYLLFPSQIIITGITRSVCRWRHSAVAVTREIAFVLVFVYTFCLLLSGICIYFGFHF